MVKLYNLKKPNKKVMEQEVPLIVKQKRFLENLIKGNLLRARDLASLPDEERFKIAIDYLLGPNKSKLEECVNESSEDSKFDNFLVYLDCSGIAPAWDLKDEPKDIVDRVIYLSLRGIRKGVLQIAEIYRITDPEKISKIGSTYLRRKFIDPLEKKTEDINEFIKKKIGINPIQEEIKRRLVRDLVLKAYFSDKGYSELFDGFCSDIALHVSTQYNGNFLEE